MAGKAELVERVAELTGYPKTQVAMTYDLLFELVSEALAENDKVTVPNFGTFQISSGRRESVETRRPARRSRFRRRKVFVSKFPRTSRRCSEEIVTSCKIPPRFVIPTEGV